MTSSRQSPRMSACNAGVALVPLLDRTPLPVRSRVSPPVPYLSIWVPSSNSRCRSPSHQITKFVEPGLRAATWAPLVAERNPPTADDQTSAPALPAQMSSATPRPLSQLQDAARQRVCPVRASASQSAGLDLSSEGL